MSDRRSHPRRTNFPTINGFLSGSDDRDSSGSSSTARAATASLPSYCQRFLELRHTIDSPRWKVFPTFPQEIYLVEISMEWLRSHRITSEVLPRAFVSSRDAREYAVELFIEIFEPSLQSSERTSGPGWDMMTAVLDAGVKGHVKLMIMPLLATREGHIETFDRRTSLGLQDFSSQA